MSQSQNKLPVVIGRGGHSFTAVKVLHCVADILFLWYPDFV